MADVSVTINPAATISATIGDGASNVVTGVSVEGSSNKTLTIYRQGADPISTSFIDLQQSGDASVQNVVYATGDQTISGAKDFITRPTVDGVGVLLSGEAAAAETGYLTGYVSKTETGDFLTNSDTGNFYTNDNPSGYITGVDLSNYVTGDVVRPSETGNYSNIFYPLSENPSEYATTSELTGVSGFLQEDLDNKQVAILNLNSGVSTLESTSATTGYVTGVSGYLQGQINNIESQTGNFVTGDVVRPDATGSFLVASDLNPYQTVVGSTGISGYLQGQISAIDLSPLNTATGNLDGRVTTLESQTGGFLTTGQGDARYLNVTGDTINGTLNIQGGAIKDYGAGQLGIGGPNGNYIYASFQGLGIHTSTFFGRSFGIYDTSLRSTSAGNITMSAPSLGRSFLDVSGSGSFSSGLTVQGNSVLTGETDPIFSASVAFSIDSTLTGQWGSGYSDSITGVSIAGSSSKTITLYQRDGGTLTANFTDLEGTGGGGGGGGSDYYLTGASFNSSNGDLTLYVNDGSTVVQSLDGRYVTGNVVRPDETGSFLVAADLGDYQTIETSTGISGYLQSQINGIDLTALENATGNLDSRVQALENETGNYLVVSDLVPYQTVENSTGISGYLQGQISNNNSDILSINSTSGAFLTTGAGDDRYALQSDTGNFVTTAQTGQFYASSNPSGYSTTGYVTGVSGYLQNQIDSINTSGASDAYVALTGDQNVSGEKRFYNEAFFESGVHLSGKLTFNTGFLPEIFDGEASWNNEYGTVQIGMNNGDVINPIGFKNFYRVKANAGIDKGKVVMAVGTVGNSEFILAQEAANIGSSGELIMGVAAEAITAGNFGDVVSFGAVKGVDTSLFNSGAILYFDPASTGGFTQTPPSPPNAKVITALNLHPSSNGTVFVRVDPGSVLGGSDSNVKFTALQDNDFISYHAASGFWRNKTLTTGDVSGISAYALAADTGSFITTAQTGQFVSTGETGSFVVSSQTGAFLTTGAADGRYALQSATGAFITSGQTGAFAASALTGAFLTTGAADALYYTLSNGQSINGFATTGFNDAITGMTITGDTTKVITLFQRDGTTVTGSFIDNENAGVPPPSEASVTISTSPPVSPSDGSLWFNSESGSLFIYYDDGDSQQWVASDNNGIGLNPVTFDASASGIFSISGQQISGVDPNADSILFWDDSESKLAHLSVGSGLSINGATLSIAATGLPSVIQVACSDESTALTAGTGKVTFRMPYAMNLTEVRSNVVVAPSGSTLIVDINQTGVSILSTELSIDAGEKTSVTAATPAVISSSSLGDDDEITIDIDQIGSSVAGAGLKITFLGIRT